MKPSIVLFEQVSGLTKITSIKAKSSALGKIFKLAGDLQAALFLLTGLKLGPRLT